jgi:HAE1 family hydrophobic/amphiphilic exporter-1
VNISETFIRRPIATSLIVAGIAMFGVIAYRALPVSDLPQVDYPTLTVSASLFATITGAFQGNAKVF